MIKLNNPFYEHLPLCDLHGEIKDTVPIILNRFIAEQLILEQYQFIIMHGIGTGVVKEACHTTLSQHESVKDFYLDPSNSGLTIVFIKAKN